MLCCLWMVPEIKFGCVIIYLHIFTVFHAELDEHRVPPVVPLGSCRLPGDKQRRNQEEMRNAAALHRGEMVRASGQDTSQLDTSVVFQTRPSGRRPGGRPSTSWTDSIRLHLLAWECCLPEETTVPVTQVHR